MLDLDDELKIDTIAKRLKLQDYLVQNLSLAISALKFLNIEYSEDNFENAKLFGRLTYVNEDVIVDVGHNPLAASSIVKALSPKKYVLIYNSYKDKDYQEILRILKPIIINVEIIEIKEKRIESKLQLQNTLNNLEIEYTTFKKINPELEYLVFGSFSVVEEFLKGNYG